MSTCCILLHPQFIRPSRTEGWGLRRPLHTTDHPIKDFSSSFTHKAAKTSVIPSKLSWKRGGHSHRNWWRSGRVTSSRDIQQHVVVIGKITYCIGLSAIDGCPTRVDTGRVCWRNAWFVDWFKATQRGRGGYLLGPRMRHKRIPILMLTIASSFVTDSRVELVTMLPVCSKRFSFVSW